MPYSHRTLARYGALRQRFGRPPDPHKNHMVKLRGPEHEQHAVKELQVMLAPLPADELTCRRFIRANKGDIKGAAKQYRGFLAWREKERVDEVLKEPLHAPDIEAELQCVGMRPLDGRDLAGRPVVVVALGLMDMYLLKKRGVTQEMLVRRHVKAMEMLVQRLREAPNPLAGCLLILDLAGCTASKFLSAWGYIREIAPICQHHYPELLSKMYFVHGSFFFKWGIDKVKLLLDPATRDKMELMCGDVIPLLRANLPLSTALPPELGIASWPPPAKEMTAAEAAAVAAAAAAVGSSSAGACPVAVREVIPATAPRPAEAFEPAAVAAPPAQARAAVPSPAPSDGTPSGESHGLPFTFTHGLPLPAQPPPLHLGVDALEAVRPAPDGGERRACVNVNAADGDASWASPSSFSPSSSPGGASDPSPSSVLAHSLLPSHRPSPVVGRWAALRPPGRGTLLGKGEMSAEHVTPPASLLMYVAARKAREEKKQQQQRCASASTTPDAIQIWDAIQGTQVASSAPKFGCAPCPAAPSPPCSPPSPSTSERSEPSTPPPLMLPSVCGGFVSSPPSAPPFGDETGPAVVAGLFGAACRPPSQPPPLPPHPERWATRPMLLRLACGAEPYRSVGFNDPSSVFPIETEFFVGEGYVRLRSLPGEPTDYFKGKARQMSTVIQGHFKKPLPVHELATGFEFDHPLQNLPARTVLRVLLSIIRQIAPAASFDLLGDKPVVLNPLFETVQRLHVAQPGDEPEITKVFEEDNALLGGAFAKWPIGWKERKRLFVSRTPAGGPYMIDPALVYTMELYEDKLCPSTYELAIGMFRYSLGRILVGGSKKPQCVTSMGQVGFQPHSRQYIFNIEMWHECLFAGCEVGATPQHSSRSESLERAATDTYREKGREGRVTPRTVLGSLPSWISMSATKEVLGVKIPIGIAVDVGDDVEVVETARRGWWPWVKSTPVSSPSPSPGNPRVDNKKPCAQHGAHHGTKEPTPRAVLGTTPRIV